MKPESFFSIVFGAGLIAVGILSLFGNMFLQLEAWRLWPIIVIVIGIVLTAPGLFGLARRGFGAFFIPGIPVLVTGGILLFASIFHRWDVWSVAWPLEVLAVALGLGLAAIFMRVAGLAIPAIIIGVNGLVLAFCNLTGLWGAWALVWPVELVAVGLGLLVVGFANRSSGAIFAAVLLFSLAGVGFFITSFFSLFNLSILRFAAPAMLIFTGILLAALAFVRRDKPTIAS